MPTKRRKKRRDGVPGDSVEEARLWARRVHSYGIAVLKLDRLMDRDREGVVRIKEIRVKAADAGRPECLVIVKAKEGDKRLVGFASALEPSEALRLAIEKVNNASMRFRDDKPYEPPSEGG